MTNNTISAWINTQDARGYADTDYDVPNNVVMASGVNTSGSTTFWVLGTVSGKLSATLDWSTLSPNTSYRVVLTGTTTITDSKWHHIVWTIDKAGNSTKLFVDGQQEASSGVGNYTDMSPNPVTNIGRISYWNGGINYFHGQMTDLEIANTVRYSSNFTPPSRLSPDANTVALWHMDDGGSSQTAADSSNAHTYNGTLGSAGGVDTNDPAWSDGAPKTTTDPFTQVTTTSSTQNFTVSPIDKLIFSSNTTADDCTPLASTPNVVVNTLTSTFTIKMCNTLNETVTLASQQINFGTSPSTGGFYNTDGSGPVASKTITSSYYTQVKFKGNTNGLDPGTYTLQASGQGQGWTGASLSEKLINDSVHHLTLSIDSHNPNDQIPAGENLTVRVVARDQYGNQAKDSPNVFVGNQNITFTGATASSTGCSSNSNTNPTVTDRTTAAIPFGTATSMDFGTADTANGGKTSGTMILKKVEGSIPTPINIAVSGGGYDNQTSPATPYSLIVIPGDLNHFDVDATTYPKSGTSQYVISEEDWATSGPKPYYPKVTVKDIYCNTKTNYSGPLWFSTEEAIPSTFGRNEAEPYTFVPGTDAGIHTFSDSTGSDTFIIRTGGDSITVHLNGHNDANNTVTSDIQVRVKGRGIDSIALTFDSSMDGQDIDQNFNSAVTVSAYDAKSNVQFDYTGLIYFTSTDPTATLPCTLNNRPTEKCQFDGVTGRLHFLASDFQFHTGGNHRITAIDDVTLKSSSPDHLAPALSSVVVVKPHTVSGVTATAVTVQKWVCF